MKNWPNFYIVGASKCGTTSLYQYLKKIPGIYMSAEKEPNYFSVTTVPENSYALPIRNEKKYLSLFKNVKDEKIIGEATTTYLEDPKAAELIHQISPNAKILISLRDPIERLFSNYLMHEGIGRTKKSFHEVIENELKNEFDNYKYELKLKRSLYSESVKRYIDTFGKDKVKIIIFEEFVKDTTSTIEEILKFLGLICKIKNSEFKTYHPDSIARGKISANIQRNMLIRKLAKSGIIPISARRFLRNKVLLKKRSMPKIDDIDRKKLMKFFYDDVQKLKKILNRELPWNDFKKI